jgi:hypothetical protein
MKLILIIIILDYKHHYKNAITLIKQDSQNTILHHPPRIPNPSQTQQHSPSPLPSPQSAPNKIQSHPNP